MCYTSDDWCGCVQKRRGYETLAGQRLKHCDVALSHLILKQNNRPTAVVCALTFPHDRKGLPIMHGHAGVVCGGERKEHDGEKDHAMVTQRCFWSNLLLGKISGGGSYSL